MNRETRNGRGDCGRMKPLFFITHPAPCRAVLLPLISPGRHIALVSGATISGHTISALASSRDATRACLSSPSRQQPPRGPGELSLSVAPQFLGLAIFPSLLAHTRRALLLAPYFLLRSVQEDILTQLQITQARRFSSSFNRPNMSAQGDGRE